MRVLFSTILIIVSISLTAQRFQAGIIAGINLSELSGDDISSYVGLNTGIVAKAKIGKNWRLSTEFLYSQAGEYVLPEYYPPANYGRIQLGYLEVPVYVSVLAYDKNTYYQKHFSIGLSYARLLSFKAEDVNGLDLTQQIIWKKRNAILGNLGVTHYFNQHTGLDFRAVLAKNTDNWTWTLSFRGVYIL